MTIKVHTDSFEVKISTSSDCFLLELNIDDLWATSQAEKILRATQSRFWGLRSPDFEGYEVQILRLRSADFEAMQSRFWGLRSPDFKGYAVQILRLRIPDFEGYNIQNIKYVYNRQAVPIFVLQLA